MGGGHHVDYQESIQRPNLYKPSVSGQRQPAARQWSWNKAKVTCTINC